MPPTKKTTANTPALRPVLRSSNGRAMPQNEDLLERAERLARELCEYDEDEQPTSPDIHVTVNVPRESQHDIEKLSEPPMKKQLKVGLAQAAMLLGLVIVTAVVGLLQTCAHH